MYVPSVYLSTAYSIKYHLVGLEKLVCVEVDGFERVDREQYGSGVGAVSYTHLTLPTNREV